MQHVNETPWRETHLGLFFTSCWLLSLKVGDDGFRAVAILKATMAAMTPFTTKGGRLVSAVQNDVWVP